MSARDGRQPQGDPAVSIAAAVAQAITVSGTEHVYVGFSGGLDSTALLLAAQAAARDQANVTLTALHVDHQLQPESAEWTQHCEQVCESLGIPLTSVRVRVATQGNLEANARVARYSFFREHVGNGLLLLAHHADDQTETALLRLFQGRGLSTMEASSQHRELSIARPLLPFRKQALLEFVQSAAVAWVEDESNAATHFDRNFLRHEIVPKLRVRFRRLDRSILRVARQHAALGRLVEQLIPDRLYIKDLARNDEERLVWLRAWLARHAIHVVTDKALGEFLAQLDRGDSAAIDLDQFTQLKRVQDEVRIASRST